jgi:hypothetical protein
MDKRTGKIILLSLVSIGLIVGGYVAYKRFYTSGKVTADAKKDRKVFMKNTKF